MDEIPIVLSQLNGRSLSLNFFNSVRALVLLLNFYTVVEFSQVPVGR